jgi:UDP-N-acetylglucosamine acyltransferase
MSYIHPTALIGPNVSISENCYIGPYCIIGFKAEHKAYWDQPEGDVVIGDNVTLTGHVTIDASTGDQPTYIGDNVWMLKHSHVGHDCWIGNDVTISCGAKIGGHTTLRYKCNIGLNAVIHQKQDIAIGCMIGMGAVVTKGLITQAFKKYAGNPAKEIGDNVIK